MPTLRITMRQIRQTLRLHHEAGLSYGQIGRALGIPKATVGKTLLMARAAAVDWATAQTLTKEELEARLYKPPVPRLDPREWPAGRGRSARSLPAAHRQRQALDEPDARRNLADPEAPWISDTPTPLTRLRPGWAQPSRRGVREASPDTLPMNVPRRDQPGPWIDDADRPPWLLPALRRGD